MEGQDGVLQMLSAVNISKPVALFFFNLEITLSFNSASIGYASPQELPL